MSKHGFKVMDMKWSLLTDEDGDSDSKLHIEIDDIVYDLSHVHTKELYKNLGQLIEKWPDGPERSVKHRIIAIVAKLDNGTHAASQLQAVDEALTKLFEETNNDRATRVGR